MSFETVTRYVLRCDDCGRRYRKAYDPVGHPTLGTMKQRLLWEARSDDWQITDTRQCCPNHWHVKCALCGRTADMTLHRLVQAGWADADPHPIPPSKCGDGRHWLAYAVRLACPECSLRLDIMDWLADRILAADGDLKAWDLSRAADLMLDSYQRGEAGPNTIIHVLEAVSVQTPATRRLIGMAAADGNRFNPRQGESEFRRFDRDIRRRLRTLTSEA
ncbi:hypothetical protein [Bifidobacterium thermophilum]|uniref:hypothetical protein n=1 Tax=Bifidobacterium thermophilum TaxID=33905 RepID=UPI003F918076